MNKLVYRAFGGLDVLELQDAAIPAFGAGEVLVRVRAAAINPVDWKMREGQLKLLSGWRMPQGLGLEFSGVIEQVGPSVRSFAVGDEVFGAAKSCIADFVVAKEGQVAKKPPGVSFAAASTIPVVGATAASLFEKAAIGEGTTVLVNGATGGIGVFATQLAVQRGAKVTAVVSERGLAMVKRWGVEHAVDYRKTRLAELGRSFDVVVELSDKLSFKEGRALLTPTGLFVASLPSATETPMGLINNLYSRQKYALMGMQANTEVLTRLAQDVAAGRVEVIIGHSFSLADFRAAYAQTAEGRFTGKVVFTLEES